MSGVIGSEFLPHLDEGAIWVRGTLAPSTGPTAGVATMDKARVILASFPEVTDVVCQVGRPDDGTDTTGFFNTEYFVDLLPKDKWRPAFHKNKDELIGAMDRQLERMPGVIWNFSQPISDNVEEAVSGVKGELAVKLYGDDLKILETKANQIVGIMGGVQGVQDLGVFRVIGQPNLDYTVDRQAAARFGINVAMYRMPFKPRWAEAPSARCYRAKRATTWWSATRSHTAIRRRQSMTFVCLRRPGKGSRSRS